MDRRQIIISAYLVVIAAALICQSGCKIQADRFNSVGRQAFEQGQYAVAINEFQQALRTNPNNADAYYNLAASYAALGKQTQNKQWIGQAEQLYRQSISLNDQSVNAHRGLAALLIESGQEQYAFDLINQWKDRYPTSNAPLVELARLYQEYGDTSRATDLLADSLRLNPNDTRTLIAMGHIREKTGQPYLAIDNYMRALQVDGSQQVLAQHVAALQTRVAALQPAGQQAPTANPAIRYGAVEPFERK